MVVNKNLSYDLFCLTVYKLFYWFLNLQNAMDGKDKKFEKTVFLNCTKKEWNNLSQHILVKVSILKFDIILYL